VAQTTYSANAVAREASKALGHTVTAKAVRGVARATLKRFDKVTHPEYQGHAYSASERTALIATMRKRAGRTAPVAKPKPRAKRPATGAVVPKVDPS
jgi:hypothetical protein